MKEVPAMDINQLVYFSETCHSGSLSKAAENLHISQQGLSVSIKRLENELGCHLFHRKPSGLDLTETGKYVLSETEAVMEHINRMYQYCQASKEGKSKITVACTINMMTRIPNALRNMLLRGSEDFDLNFFENWTFECENMVSENKANFGLVYGPCDEDRFQIKVLDSLKQVFIVNRLSPLAAQETVTLAELAGCPLVIPAERCRPGKTIRKMFRDADVTPNIVYTCDRPRQILDMVTNDTDICARILQDDISPSDLENVKVLTLADDPFLLPICLIYKKGQKLTMQERLFSHLVTDFFARETL